MEWWNGMDGSDQNLVKFVLVGMAIVAVLVGWLIIRRIKQGRLREAFTQTYGLELPKNCRVRMDKPSINSLVLAYPYVDGTRTNYTDRHTGWDLPRRYTALRVHSTSTTADGVATGFQAEPPQPPRRSVVLTASWRSTHMSWVSLIHSRRTRRRCFSVARSIRSCRAWRSGRRKDAPMPRTLTPGIVRTAVRLGLP